MKKIYVKELIKESVKIYIVFFLLVIGCFFVDIFDLNFWLKFLFFLGVRLIGLM